MITEKIINVVLPSFGEAFVQGQKRSSVHCTFLSEKADGLRNVWLFACTRRDYNNSILVDQNLFVMPVRCSTSRRSDRNLIQEFQFEKL